MKKVYRKSGLIIVEGVNLREVKIKFHEDNTLIGSKTLVTAPVHIHKLRLIDPSTDRPGKVDLGYLEDGSRVRVFRGTGTVLPIVNSLVPYEERHKDREDGPFDTPGEQALEVGFTRSRIKGRISRKFTMSLLIM